ncbi:DUF1292 domain-containing protein [Isachenkonia alkalipeptolytica]|uniref:UPF0473 protein ISALK_03880 n=1 Tax=Isachenkonia alkalipeptolytica TaxID=2565777 RepID=A0AA43XIY5_9CLOT|nr:DUF1292 domain-containing protein [Isachenkonia alkalipeptolytica]NBG87633.1 DUF1292 domain-containing protein [Isachenkonia alkalipeptolytica]
MEEKENIITLIDENDEEKDFEIIMTLELEGKEYTILMPLEEEEEEEAYVFRIENEGVAEDDFVLVAIEDDEEYQKVVDAYETIVEEDHDHSEEEEE